MDPAKLKVVELRAELSARGLDTKGVKAILVDRLRKALGIADSSEAGSQEETDSTDNETIAPRTPRGGRSRRRSPSPRIDSEITPRRTTRRKSSVDDPAPTPVKIQHTLSQITESETEQEDPGNTESVTEGITKLADEETKAEIEDSKNNEECKLSESRLEENTSREVLYEIETDVIPEISQQDSTSSEIVNEGTKDEPEVKESSAEDSSNDAPEMEAKELSESKEESAGPESELMEVDSCSKPEETEDKSEQEFEKQEEDIQEDDLSQDSKIESEKETSDLSEKEKEDRLEDELLKSQDDDPVNISMDMDESDSNKDNLSENVKLEDSEVNTSNGSPASLDVSKTRRKEKRSRWSNFQDQKEETEKKIAQAEEAAKRSPEVKDDRYVPKRKHSHSRSPVKMLCEEDEVKLEGSASNVLLSWFDSDLHLSIDRETLCSASPLTIGALSHVWAGARSDRGVAEGCVAYEVLIDKYLKVEQKDEDSHLIRIGWSSSNASLQLGEDVFSYGYDSSAKFVDNNEFKDYGKKLNEKDIVGVYLDLDSTPCSMKFTVNGEEQGVAKEFEKSELSEKALFPHILTKNISYKVNFGQNAKSLLNRPKIKKVLKPKSEEMKVDEPQKIDSEQTEPMETESKIEKVESEAKEVESEAGEVKIDKDDTETTQPSEEEKNIEIKSEEESKDEPADVKNEKDDKGENVDIPDENVGDKNENIEAKNEQVDVKDEIPKSVETESDVKQPEVSELTDDVYEYIEEEEEGAEQYFILSGYEYIGKISLEKLQEGATQPDTRRECEVLMLCGLPGVGKTHWVEKWVREHPEKRYTVLGTHELVSRMKVNGELKKTSYKGNWQALLESCSKSISELVNIAGKRRRNCIIDQNNVYTAVQVRKISNFGEFVRKAIVIVPSQEEWDKRMSERDTTTAEEVAESEMLTMKANFVLPEVNDYFDQVIFAELSEDEAKVLIEKYNTEGRDAGYAMRPNKRSRFDTSSDRSGHRGGSDRRYNNDRRDRRNERSSSGGSGGGYNRRGNDRHNERMDRGGPQRWGPGPRFGGPPPPLPNWAGHRNNQWRGRDRPPPGWRGGPNDHRGGGDRGHHNDPRGPHGGRMDFRGGRGGPPGAGGYHRGGQSRGSAGGAGQGRDATGGNAAGRWNRGGQGAGGDARRGQNAGGRGGHQQGQGHWNPNNWNNSGAGGQNQWGQQQWGQGWGQQTADQQATGQQDWSGAAGQQQWNQNWQQQNWNQQNWGNGWKGYGQGWNQYWNQWGQQTQQAEGAGANTSSVTATTNSAAQSGTATTAANNQYSTTYPNVQYSNAGNTSGSQYPAQYSTDNATMMAGANQTPDQIAQVYQSWAQYAQAFANYGQQQNAAAAASTTSQKAGIGDKKKKK